MFENDAKGWHGSYSKAGRSSAEQYNVKLNNGEIFPPEPSKRIQIKDFFSPDETKYVDPLEKNIEFFKVYSDDPKDKLSFITQNNKDKQPETVDKLKYHNKHKKEALNKKNVKINPASTKYNPKHDVIRTGTLTGPNWGLFKGREKKNPEPDLRQFYLQHERVNEKMYCFINMNQQTQRGNFAGNKDVRIRSDKPFNKNKDSNELNTITEQELPKITTNSTLMKSYKVKNNLYKQLSKSVDNKYNNSKVVKHKNVNQVKAPDFEKMISREKFNKTRDIKRKDIVSLLNPNYNVTRERVLTMTIYDIPKKVRTRKKEYVGIDPSISFDPDRVIKKVNNHINPTPPDFNLMTSRAVSKGPLPSFMHQMFNREMGYLITDKSLELNNYRNGKFMAANTSFWPKKSFNRIVNMNLMTLKKFKLKKNLKELNELSDMQKASLENSMRNCGQRFDDLVKEGYLNKFDIITYKTNKRENKLNTKGLEDYIISFENVE